MDESPDLIGPFSRQQLADLTRIDSSTLNYWMREGVLRADSGGHGRGSHRRFAYLEVTLAAVLNELRSFGIGTPQIAKIAQRFHDALDWMASRGISRTNLQQIDRLQSTRKITMLHGVRQWFIHKTQLHLVADLETYEHAGRLCVDMDWDRCAQHFQKEWVGNSVIPTADDISLVGRWSHAEIDAFRDNEPYFKLLSELKEQYDSPKRSTSPQAFYRDSNGDWQFAISYHGVNDSVSYIGVDIELLKCKLWGAALTTTKAIDRIGGVA